jgi:hypothetical protein
MIHQLLRPLYGLNPDIIVVVRNQNFSGAINEETYNYLREFEDMCLSFVVQGMMQETLRWKLFPFSLTKKAKQWYIH